MTQQTDVIIKSTTRCSSWPIHLLNISTLNTRTARWILTIQSGQRIMRLNLNYRKNILKEIAKLVTNLTLYYLHLSNLELRIVLFVFEEFYS